MKQSTTVIFSFLVFGCNSKAQNNVHKAENGTLYESNSKKLKGNQIVEESRKLKFLKFNEQIRTKR